MSKQAHWQKVYSENEAQAVSWYRDHLNVSLELLRLVDLPTNARILDAGGGASTFVDDVLDMGFSQVTVVDLSDAALLHTRTRLGDRGANVVWMDCDVTALELPAASVDFWHDRAVFHFLTSASEREAYLARVRKIVAVGGYVMLATFHEDGPEKCSGLPVQRYNAEQLAAVIGAPFRMLQTRLETHVTPWQSEQKFVYALFQRSDERSDG